MEIVVGGKGGGSRGCGSCAGYAMLAIGLVLAAIALFITSTETSRAKELETEAGIYGQPLSSLQSLRAGDAVRLQTTLGQPNEQRSPGTGQPCIAWSARLSLESASFETRKVSKTRMVTRERLTPQGTSERFRTEESYEVDEEVEVPHSQDFYSDLQGPDSLQVVSDPVEVRMPLSGWVPHSFSATPVAQVPPWAKSAVVPRPHGTKVAGLKLEEAFLTAGTPYHVTAKVMSREGNVLTIGEAKFEAGSSQDLAAGYSEKAAEHRTTARYALLFALVFAVGGAGMMVLAFKAR